METAIVWFRRDLRVHDNPTLVAAASADVLLPVAPVDPASFGRVAYGGPHSFTYRKTGAYRAAFLVESLADLRDRLEERGLALSTPTEPAAEAIPRLADRVDADVVHCQRLPAPEERERERRVREALAERGIALESHWTHTLHHPAELPVEPSAIDDTFTPWRERVEAESRVRPTVDEPDLDGPTLPAVTPEALPTLADLGFPGDPEPDERRAIAFEGGESAALDRLEEYLWATDELRRYKRRRNELLGRDFSSKLSPWLAAGCLSPRRVSEEIDRYEDERVANDSTYWLRFELRWRDFFQFQCVKHGAALFRREGIRRRTDLEWRYDEAAFERWCRGETGIPFVDANLRELNGTGYMSNRGRQNVASLLANDLGIDWRLGAAYFESQLVDYDPASNYGNWAYVAGVGNDSRDRSFDVLRQADRYDPDAEYVKRWLPELAELPAEYAHRPWRLTPELAEVYGLTLGETYPEPIVSPDELEG